MSASLEIHNLRIEGRSPDRRWTPIVDDVSFAIEHGEVVGLIGESGAGKSTIALASLAYARPGCRIAAGRIVFDGTNILNLDGEDRRRFRGRRMAYIAQSALAAFNPALPISRQITEAPIVHHLVGQSEATNHMRELSKRMQLPDLSTEARQYPHQFSGGQLQRFMAVMAMSCQPTFVVFDEPTTAIDVTTQVEVLKAFKDLARQSGMAAIYVTHDLAVVSQIADRIVVLRDGRIVEIGPVGTIIESPRETYTKQLISAVRPAPRSLSRDSRPGDRDASDPVIEVTRLDASYGPLQNHGVSGRVLNDITFVVPRGQTVGVIGESGSGKSTLARTIAGLLPTYRGTISLHGRELARGTASRRKDELRRVQLVTQNPDVSFNPKSKVDRILERPLQFYYGMPYAERRARASELLRMVGLPDSYLGRYPQELSGGEKQRLSLARALAANPDVVLCDEVTSALDTIVSAEIIELLRDLQEKLATAFVFISHDLSTVASFADRIVVLYAGRILEQGPTAQVLSPPYHPYTKLLLDSVPEMQPGWLEACQARTSMRDEVGPPMPGKASGCPFLRRCPLAISQVCDRRIPPVHCLDHGHEIACHRPTAELGE